MTEDPTTGDAPTSGPSTSADRPTPGDAPTPLEQRYRRLLRLLPRAYRDVRADEMVAVFLARARLADPENYDLTVKYGGPGWAETWSVIALALRLRWADPAGPDRFRLRARALRGATLACLTVVAVLAVEGLLGRLWTALWWHDSAPSGTAALRVGEPAHPVWTWIHQWVFVLWIGVLALALVRRPSARRWAAALAAVPVAVGFATGAIAPVWQVRSAVDLVIGLAVIAGLLLMGTARPDGPAPSRTTDHRSATPHTRLLPRSARGYLVTGAALFAIYEAIAVAAWLTLLPLPDAGDIPLWVAIASVTFLSNSGFWLMAALAAGAVTAVRRRRGGPVGVGSLAAVAAVAGAALATHLATLVDVWIPLSRQGSGLFGIPDWSVWLTVLIQSALLVVIGAAASAAMARRIRTLAPVSYAGSLGSPR